MTEWGITQDRYHFADGSGLSKDNKISCSALTDVLDRLYHEFEAGPEFISSLAVMGKDGSVRQRDLGTTDSVKVKTGTLDAVSAISGYYPLKNGDVLGFSIFFNDLTCYNGMAHDIQNRLLMELSSLNGHTGE
jgi:D-alanyl-D-alanine carboxypeptidase/D-alanyl-D-alanine-endopeptidase (penicillin-binding protein 4)